MRPITAVIPVYNEELIIADCLKHIVDFVDNIVLVDGSPDGNSTDETKALATELAGKKLKYLTYNGGKIWRLKDQIKHGISQAGKGSIMQISTDMIIIGLDELDSIDSEDAIYFCRRVEFWNDIYHAKEIVRWPMLIPVSMYDKVLTSKPQEIDCLPVINYHLGWLRPFEDQISKHTRNIIAGGWKDLGQKLMALGDDVIEAWAIHHILGYSNHKYTEITVHREISKFSDWSPKTGIKQYIQEYEKRHEMEFYTSIMQLVPPELIVR